MNLDPNYNQTQIQTVVDKREELINELHRQMVPRLSEAAWGGNAIPPSDLAHPP